jgi:quinol monooxygenase YgiN
MIAVTLRLVARPEARDELLHRVRSDMLGPTRAEPGCVSYRFYQDVENPNAFSFVELWRDYESLDGHFRSDHVGAFLGRLPDLVAEAPVARFDRIAETRGAEAIEQARKAIQAEM